MNNMYEDFSTGEHEREDEDSDSESYSYPFFKRFNYTGKSKSRLGRNHSRVSRPSIKVDVKADNSRLPVQGAVPNSQAPITPGMSWLLGDSRTHPITPRSMLRSSNTLRGSQSNVNDSGIDISSQSNILSNVTSDTDHNSSCKRNLAFTTTPFKKMANPESAFKSFNPLFFKETNPFATLDFSSGKKEENKENVKNENIQNVKNNEIIFDPPRARFKRIGDDDIHSASAPQKSSDISGIGNLEDKDKFARPINEQFNANFLSLHKPLEKMKDQSKDDDSSGTPLDLSSGESLTGKNLFNKALISENESLDLSVSDRSDKSKSLSESNDLNLQCFKQNNTDTLSSFLPKFLAPTMKPKAKDYNERDTYEASSVTSKRTDTNSNCAPPYASLDSYSLKMNCRNQVLSCGSQEYNKSHPNPLCPQLPSKQRLTDQHLSSTPDALGQIFSQKPQVFTESNQHSNNSTPSSYMLPDVQTCIRVDNQETSKEMREGKIQDTEIVRSAPIAPSSTIGKIQDLQSNKETRTEEQVKQSQLIGHLNYLQLEQNNSSVIPNKSLVTSLEIQKGPLASNSHLLPSGGFTEKSSQNVIDPKLQPSLNEQILSSFSNDNNATNICTNNGNFNQHQETSRKPAGNFQPTANINLHSNSNLNVRVDNQLKQFSQINPEPQTQHKKEKVIESPENKLNKNPSQPQLIPPDQQVCKNQYVASSNLPSSTQASELGGQKTYLAPPISLHQKTSGFNSDFPHVKPGIPHQSNRQSYSMKKPQNDFKMPTNRGLMSRANTELYVNNKTYTILSMLGRGGSSEVFQVLDPRTSKLLAVKCVDLSMVDKTIADGYLNEIALLSKLQGCASVIRMFDCEYLQEEKSLYVVMEKGDTDLSQLIRDISKTKKISMSMIIYFWTEMLTAVRDIHERGIIHSDLKPANFLLVSGRLKLIDFGIASSQGDMTSVEKEVTTGTWNYMSPEAIRNTSTNGKAFKITYKSDVWSLGCILYNLLYGKTPFSHITHTWGKLQAIADPSHQIEFPNIGAPVVLSQALRSCLIREPKQRPTVADLLALCYDTTHIGRQIHSILPPEWWLKVAHLFPEIDTRTEDKKFEDNTR